MTVHLVGAGPGDPELLTRKAERLLSEADVVVHDRLVGAEILALAAPWAELIDVGKDPNGRRTSQERINEILLERGRHHATVVRLKGGDPFVFGRGGEEAVALRDAGIDVAVVPGVTSAIAGPALAGVPVTHRGASSAFTVVTAHEDPTKTDALNWHALAELGTTLVILMGARRAEKIRTRLLEAGMRGDMPVAIVTEATTPNQRTRFLELDELGIEPVANPSVIVVGAVAGAPVLPPLPQLASATAAQPTHHTDLPTASSRPTASVRPNLAGASQ
ncbi:MAG: uroporphyrinogen-III C-methyltransferase [Actinomycetota bacterium]